MEPSMLRGRWRGWRKPGLVLLAAATLAVGTGTRAFSAMYLASRRDAGPRSKATHLDALFGGLGSQTSLGAEPSANLMGVSAGIAVLGVVAAATGGARWRQRQSKAGASQTRSVACAAADPSQWQPRTTGWSAQELAAERSRAESLPGPDAGYSGPHYQGPSSVTADFIDTLIAMQEKGTLMPKKYLYLMVLDVIDLLRKETTIPEVSINPSETLTVVGDLHGQYWDFMNLLELAGRPSPTSPFIFNGDFVDRGSWSIEVITVLYAFKLKDPTRVHMNRGNHEMLETNILYGFCGECAAKYDTDLFNLFSESFRHLPLAHLVDKSVLVLHGGLPGPEPRIWMPGQTHDPTDAIPMTTLPSLAQMGSVDRYLEISPEAYTNSIGPTTADKTVNDERMMIDILWGDPRGGDGYGPSYRKGKGVYMYGPDVTTKFCQENNLQYIIRSHEVKADGFRWDHKELVTVFSAPNYLDTGNNKAAFLRLTHSDASQPIKIEPTSFEAVPHPDLPPMHWQQHFMDNFPHLTRKMKKKVTAASFDEFGDSDFEGLMNFDEWEPDEADQFQEAFKVDQYGRPLS